MSELPNVDAIRRLLLQLLDRAVVLNRAPAPMKLGPKSWVATYVADSGTLAYAIAVDVGFIATVGAALSMVPPAVAQEGAKGKLTETLVLNAQEVLNVLGLLFNELQDGTVHVRLERLVEVEKDPKVLERVPPGKSRIDLAATVAGYPTSGVMTILAVA